MMFRRLVLSPVFVLAALFVAFLLPQAARADSIDGEWCSAAGRRIHIEGSAFSMSGRGNAQGAYSRHHFTFSMPDGEPDAGVAVEMVLQGETRIRVRIGLGEPEIWHRCPPGIS